MTSPSRPRACFPDEYEIPVKIESEANQREHWAVKAKRAKLQRNMACALTKFHPLPVTVTLTRVGVRLLDDDNLAGGFKAVRDGIADRLGVPDNDPRITWRYEQRKGNPKQYTAFARITQPTTGASS